jgi:hypothetical protein
MIRTLTVSAMVALVVAGWSAGRNDPNACKLYTVAEASTLAGTQLSLKRQQANADFATCVYALPDPTQFMPNVTVSYGAWPDANTAHTRFMGRVQPGATQSPYSTVIPVKGLGDEATIKQSPKVQASSIDVRKGTYVVSFGVMPHASDSALEAAAKTALSRLP